MLVVLADHLDVSVERGVVPAPQFELGASATIRSKVGHCVRPAAGVGLGGRDSHIQLTCRRGWSSSVSGSFVARLSLVFRGDRCDGEGCLARREVLVFVPVANAAFAFGVGFGVVVCAGEW